MIFYFLRPRLRTIFKFFLSEKTFAIWIDSINTRKWDANKTWTRKRNQRKFSSLKRLISVFPVTLAKSGSFCEWGFMTVFFRMKISKRNRAIWIKYLVIFCCSSFFGLVRMRLSTVFELLLIFLLIAFAASRVIGMFLITLY